MDIFYGRAPNVWSISFRITSWIWWRLDMEQLSSVMIFALQWCHNGRDGVSNHEPHLCFLRRISKTISKLRVTGLCAGNSPHHKRGKCFHLITSSWWGESTGHQWIFITNFLLFLRLPQQTVEQTVVLAVTWDAMWRQRNALQYAWIDPDG